VEQKAIGGMSNTVLDSSSRYSLQHLAHQDAFRNIAWPFRCGLEK
jgi:hypothetical protein